MRDRIFLKDNRSHIKGENKHNWDEKNLFHVRLYCKRRETAKVELESGVHSLLGESCIQKFDTIPLPVSELRVWENLHNRYFTRKGRILSDGSVKYSKFFDYRGHNGENAEYRLANEARMMNNE